VVAPSDDPVAAGRGALERHAWTEAYEVLTRADGERSLGGEGLTLLAAAAYWTAHPDETVEYLERAYGVYVEEDDRKSASMVAFRVAEQHGMRMALPQAQGWAARAMHLAEDEPAWPVHGWLAWMQGLLAWFAAEYERAIGAYDLAIELASASNDRDLLWMSVHDKGHALCLVGQVDAGRALLDEAMAAVVGGELGPDAAGYVYCGMIGACSKLGDYGRSAEWTDATLRWCERESIPAFPGVCRIHRAELMRLRGSLAEAEEQARMACEELPRFNFFSGLGPAYYEIGEVRRLMGDFRGAEEAHTQAMGYGFDPQPGLALTRLGQGDVGSAAAGIKQALAGAGDNRCRRVRLLAAQAEIALAMDDLVTATAADEALASVVTDFEALAVRSLAAHVHGAVLLAHGDPAGALPELRRAQEGWQQVGAPYEVAGSRALMARALHALGEDSAAVLELTAARSGFERVGAVPALDAATGLLSEIAADGGHEHVARGLMFTDIVKSTDLIGLIGDDAWEDLLRWHDQMLGSEFAAHGGSIAHHTGDGFFVTFDDAATALECAVGVQRALIEHRRDHGFAPLVRIGVHIAEATRRGADYSGGEVHKAARIAALAEGGQIVASADAIRASDHPLRTADHQTVTLKGVPFPVEVARIDWQHAGT
jgi:class 3 adenylate cyclase